MEGFGAVMSFLALTLVLHLAWISTGEAATAETAHAAHASQWALETFVDVTAADGAVLQVELRRHCCHGIAETAARFCDEFKVPAHDCVRLEQLVVLAPNKVSECECAKVNGSLSRDRAKKLHTATVRVLHTHENRTQLLKLALHEGDVPFLDTRIDSLCERFELDPVVCGTLRESLRDQSVREEIKHHRQKLLEHTSDAAVVHHVMTAIEKLIRSLLIANERLRSELELRAQAYAALELQANRERHALQRRIRELERERSRRLHTSRALAVSSITNPSSSGEQLPAFATSSLRIPRAHVGNFSYAQYLAFATTYTPVIIQGFADLPGSPGLPQWTLPSLQAACGDAVVTLKRRVSKKSNRTNESAAMAWAGIEPVTKVPLRYFLRDFTTGGAATAWPYGYADLYLHDASIRDFCPHLLSSFTIPRFFTDDRLQLLSISKQTDYWPSLFIGGTSTASALHADWASTAAWMGLLAGRKHWAIAKPSARAALMELFPTDQARTQGRFNSSLLSGEPHSPLLRPGEIYEDILEAGEVLFIPADCPHQVQNLDKTIAVAANFVDSTNLAAFQHQVQVAKDSTAGDHARRHTQTLRILEDHAAALRSAGPPPEPSDLTYAQFKERYKNTD